MMMLVTRLVLVVTALVLAVHGEEVGTPVAVRDDVVTLAAPTRDRQRVDKGTFTSIIEPTGSSSSFHRTGLPDAAAVREKIELRHRKHDVNTADNRQGRMALHAEAPSSKAKREQALRNILAARRRQLLGPRVSEAPRSASPSPRKSRPTVSLSRDPPDMLEAQETRHGIYVTAPIGDEVSIVMENDEDDTSKFASPENPARSPPTSDDLDRSSKNSLLIRINDTDSWLSALSRDNDTSSKNSSVARAQKILDHDIRRKNTVAMPESLYNHFRPVESNIPVEDMTQFLYFGQKIPAESHNSTGSSNNSVLDGTSTSSSVASSRRRYSMKRFSTTTPITVPRLEEIVNEEMNIALERSTIERNKIPKTKNQFRPPGTGTYFRKSSVRSSDPTIVSNVILSRESSRNASAVVSEDRRESVPLRNSGKFHSDQSAHALQVVIVEDGGSGADTASAGSAAAAHRAGNATAGNAADSTQLPRDTEEAVSKVKRHQRKDHSPADDNGQSRNSTANTIGSDSLPVPSMNRETATSGPASSASDYDKTDEKLNKITTWQTVHSNEESTTFSTRTMNDLTETPQSRSHSTIATSSSPAHSGSLRIVVTEPMPYDSRVESGNEDEVTSEDTSKSVDEGAIDRSNSRLTENPSTPSFLSANESSSTDASIELTLASSIANKRSDTPVSSSVVKTETKQHHAYAYEITNVTRLLRNYTGPGLSAASEQQPGRENGEKEDIARETDEVDGKRSTTTKKGKRIEEPGRTVERGMEVEDEEEGGSALRRTDVGSVEQIRNGGGSARPTPQRQPLPLLLPTLQRSSSSSGGTVEPARTTGELSAGTDVGETTATSTGRSSTLNSSNAGTTIIISAGGNSYTPSETAVSRASGGSSQAPSSSASSHSYHLVGERGRKGAAGAKQQYHQQNQNRGSGGGIGIGSRNTSPTASTPVATTEVSGASTAGVDQSATSLPAKALDIDDHVTDSALPTSTLRWNHTGINRAAAGGVLDRPEALVSDRRYMRKSVSAVLNQRTVEEGLTKESKRRRGGSLFSAASVNSRRIKNSRIGASEESRVLASRSMENRTGLTENGEAGSGTSQATVDLDGVAIQRQSDRIGSSAAMTEKQLESTEKHSLEIESQVDSTSMAMDKVQETTVGTTIAPTTTLESPSTRLTDGSKDQTEKVYASAQSVEQSNATDGDSASFPNETTNDSSESLSTLTPSTTSSSNTVETTKEVESTTVPAPPAFPVTPRMLKEDDEVTEVNVESADETKRNGTQEADRPFGLAKDLDPSEIQKMYRSQTTLKPEVAATTMIPQDIERSTDYPVTTTAAAKDQSRTMNPVNSSITRRPAGGERSPEVRGRNLSDKSKDKDDVLPIMQLYNTSNIFNGTAKDSQEAVSTARPLALPGAIEVNATRTENESDSPSATTLEPETSESSARQRNPEDRRTVNKNQEDNQATGIPKRNRHGDGTEESHESVLPATRWSNHSSTGSVHNSSGAYANRTRNRPTYYHTTPPEFVGYRPEFNSSFFEPGMISVSPRESVNVSEVITKRHDGDTIATQETVAVVAYILATLVVFPIAVGVGLILRRLIIRNRKVLEESDTSSEISCRKDALNLENGDFKTSIEKAITKLPRIQHLCHDAEKPPPPPTQESRWEFPRDKLRLQTVLGQGNFGQVWKAEADDLTGHQGTTRLVAVKTVKEGASAREKEDLVRELEIMQQLGNHPNVVTLLGCCTEEEPHYLILEYVMYGKLLAYLRDHRTRQDFYNFSEDSAALTSRDLTVFGYCVARGMEYLASKKIIHRDLAARNVLVDHNKLCKIADFGMSRFANDDGEVIEARHGRNALPIRWMAPESLIYSLFTTKTDVWSFGILMWEIVTLGSTPYPDMAAREVMRNVQNGYRLERPSHCRSELFRVIARCWHADPDRRPEFQILRRDMAQLLEDSMNGHYVDLESFASECTD